MQVCLSAHTSVTPVHVPAAAAWQVSLCVSACLFIFPHLCATGVCLRVSTLHVCSDAGGLAIMVSAPGDIMTLYAHLHWEHTHTRTHTCRETCRQQSDTTRCPNRVKIGLPQIVLSFCFIVISERWDWATHCRKDRWHRGWNRKAADVMGEAVKQTVGDWKGDSERGNDKAKQHGQTERSVSLPKQLLFISAFLYLTDSDKMFADKNTDYSHGEKVKKRGEAPWSQWSEVEVWFKGSFFSVATLSSNCVGDNL